MPEQNDLPYLLMRERYSRELSLVPGDAAVQRAHLAMADRYAKRIAESNLATLL